ncbi:hypothetical protein [Paenibacillus sp. DMB20]|uniref:hypothetical protein n=1 Tax=Paenibacillus sp. DMB20 TaxID=1642570 RepID=UPI00069B1DD2|nr:hypothetical protein [Paenibacillus sp. DMB20]
MNPTDNDLGYDRVPANAVRQWRVGSLSMGVSLLLLGVLVLTSQWKGTAVFDSAMKWWPVVFILLGAEVVGYTLFFRKAYNVKYDVFSILLIGFLTLCCVGLAALSTTGLLDQIRRETVAVQKTVPIPEIRTGVPDGVNKIIVQGSYVYQIKKDSSSSKELLVFGSVRTADEELLKGDGLSSLIQMKQAGNVLYVNLLEPPRFGLNGGSSNLEVTVSAPADMKVTVRDPHGNTR